jgi:hypothetical protein
MGASLAAWFADAHNKLLLNELRDAGIAVCQEDPAAADVVTEDAAIDVPGSIPGEPCFVTAILNLCICKFSDLLSIVMFVWCLSCHR